ncbi:DUF3108 domain-containing protein [Noviherbaspirillum denitrificans]|uniref:DUF3108 domain-containing protein n=1 Tax=Noviherbaspirillum denitrificans TaxID=1968433 RepID=A0A254TEY1_9BURK|nr:DUF3108 domain-containing protein [Noviherbaspirillum denitrificans]OWW20717.1 hypothetical protein AYR66_15725 [Noviherbaspirillum denitrificans]
MNDLKRLPLAALFCGLLASSAAIAAPAAKYKTSLPPPVELSYAIKAKQKGIPLEGESLMRWSIEGGKFSATNEARAPLFGKILDTRSEGEVDAYGLAPSSFTEKRFRKEAATTTFDRAAGTIRFANAEQTTPIRGGEQDRNSVIWELVSVARGAQAKFKPGTSWEFVVAGVRDAEPWTFKVVAQEKLRTPLGEVNSLHVTRAPMADSNDHHIEIWLAPSMEWYPVRVRYSEDDGDYIEQTLRAISRKTP